MPLSACRIPDYAFNIGRRAFIVSDNVNYGKPARSQLKQYSENMVHAEGNGSSR